MSRWRRALAAPLFAVCLLALACASSPDLATPLRVLFVGNSLTSYNDLPAKFAALRAASHPGGDSHIEMLAAGGASLRDRIRDGSLERTLAAGQYDVVVLQDFGGWPLCSTRIPACEDGTQSLRNARALVQQHGARPIWYATWIALPPMQAKLSAANTAVASEVGVEFVDVGKALHALPSGIADVLRSDGHPTSMGSWLAATVLLQAMEPATKLPATGVTACGHRWEGSDLRGDSLASSQPARKRECEHLDGATLRSFRAALEQMTNSAAAVAASEKPHR